MKRTALLALSLMSTPAFADPGHGMAGNIIHLLTEPDHLAIIVLVAAAGWYSYRRLRARA